MSKRINISGFSSAQNSAYQSIIMTKRQIKERLESIL